ncbi:hypothetical protein GM921_09665 [Pedobacter sp. LMG 31464]|uniref:37-kD nucleoid-associated bacterial protein n=1 Tax=Pedobacter planticolens TaxID=2679964 RepID=A0A923IVD8_9SPHI|nr:hypothetical protein [Pedobacter planticolens]MBB2145753.1 hypothetical protein [Pedobacter planticolens]
MDIIFNALYKIDVAAKATQKLPHTEEQKELESYVRELLDLIVDEKSSRGYEFTSEHTEVRSLISEIIGTQYTDLSTQEGFAESIAKRLLAKEIDAEENNNLNIKLVKGIAVITLIQLSNGERRFVISKADYNEYLDAESYKRRNGFPLKKKIYKAFSAALDEENNISKILVYDTNSTFSVYWWREFLELSEIYTDDYNTEKVFAAIEGNVLNPIKQKHKADFISLWNAAVHYFRVKPEFTVEGFLDDIINTYEPFDSSLDVGSLAKKVEKQFENGKFDKHFKIVPKVITKKFKRTIQLTSQIDLNLKDGIQNIEQVIKRFQDKDGSKWVMVRSAEGYEYFKDQTELLS